MLNFTQDELEHVTSYMESQAPDLKVQFAQKVYWPAPGFEDTEIGVLMEPEVDHGTTEVHAGVQA
jgi:hypothetical protein